MTPLRSAVARALHSLALAIVAVAGGLVWLSSRLDPEPARRTTAEAERYFRSEAGDPEGPAP